MEIIARLMKESEFFGYLIKDGDLIYPVHERALHNSILFKELLKNSWELKTYPYGFYKNSVEIACLPSKQLTEFNFSEMDLQEMDDMLFDILPESIIKSHITTKPEFLPIAEGLNIITTREAFLDFIQDKFLLDEEMYYLPLNLLVSPEALFSAEEYFSKENRSYRRLIEKRRNLNLYSLKQLQSTFIKMGLSEDFTAKDLINFYFQWGICGIRCEIYDKTSSTSKYVLATSGQYEIMKSTIGYVDMSGKVVGYPTDIRWKCEKETKPSPKFDSNIEPCTVVAPIINTIELWKGENTLFEIDTTDIRITTNRNIHTLTTLRVKDSLYNNKNLPMDLWNLKNIEEFYEDLILRLASDCAINNTVIKSDVSSYKALIYMGCSPLSAITRIVNNYELSVETENDDSDENTVLPASTVLNLVKQYLSDNLDDDHMHYTLISNFVSDILDGNVNIDNLAINNLSNEYFQEKVYNTLKVARKYLDIPLQEIIDSVYNISPTQSGLKFSNNNLILNYEIGEVDSNLTKYKLDLKKYSSEKVDSVVAVIRVTGVYREMAPKGIKQRHLAVRYDVIHLAKCVDRTAIDILSFKKDNSFEEAYIKMYNDAVIHIKEFSKSFKDTESYITQLSSGFLNQLFSIMETGELKFPEDWGIPNLHYEEYVKTMLYARYSENNVESLWALVDNVCNEYGAFYWHCSNAFILPHYVIPHKGVILKEMPFQPAWVAPSSMEVAASWYEKGWTCCVEGERLIARYDSCALLSHRESSNTISGFKYKSYTLHSYFERMQKFRNAYMQKLDSSNLSYEELKLFEAGKNNEPFIIPDLPMYIEYPKLSEIINSEYYVNMNEVTTSSNYTQGTILEFSRDDIMKKSEFARWLDNTSVKVENTIELFTGVKPMLDDVNINSDIVTPLLLKFDKNLERVLHVFNKQKVLFPSSQYIDIKDLFDLDESIFAIKKINNNMLIFEDIHNLRYTVRKREM